MQCSVCGLDGAWVSVEVDDYNNPSGEYCHIHCYTQHGKSFIEYTRLGTSRYHSFSRVKRIALSGLRRGSRMVYHVGTRKRRTMLF